MQETITNQIKNILGNSIKKKGSPKTRNKSIKQNRRKPPVQKEASSLKIIIDRNKNKKENCGQNRIQLKFRKPRL